MEIRGGVTRRDEQRTTNNKQGKIGLLSFWAVGRLSFATKTHIELIIYSQGKVITATFGVLKLNLSFGRIHYCFKAGPMKVFLASENHFTGCN